jgi:hypothetical protein
VYGVTLFSQGKNEKVLDKKPLYFREVFLERI